MTSERFIWILFGVIGVLLALGLGGTIYPKIVAMINGL